ncbi:MAG: trypsin-like peptidase domain-containing protein [Pontixanthobacter sp.]
MTRWLLLIATLCALMLPAAVRADPADVNAAARGVVRVVIVGSDGEEVFPISHGTGFAVSPNRIVTNAHVVREAAMDRTLRIGIVPPQGNGRAFAKISALSPRNDLALLEIVGDLRLPPLTIAGASPGDSGNVSAVGYPMNVDRAQGLEMNDIFNSQPPVKSRGFLSGARPSRQFDTILHTAPIARGNSGGPLLDECGRVVGVNSFGADSGGSDAEFFFAVSTRELTPFLRENGVKPSINALPCRSLAELDAAEAERLAGEQAAARTAMSQRAQESRSREERLRLKARLAVQEERENAMAMAFICMLIAFAAGAIAWRAYAGRKEQGDVDENGAYAGLDQDSGLGAEKTAMIAGTIAAVALVAAIALWLTRPGLDAIDRRVNAGMAEADETPTDPVPALATDEVALTCSLDVARSRITGTPNESIDLSWSPEGCVNGRTQYGFTGGNWSRVFVPNSEDTVSVNRFDVASRTFRTDRYLLGRSAIGEARAERGRYSPPECGTDGAAAQLGDMQGAITALLPQRPNERLVYSCTVTNP